MPRPENIRLCREIAAQGMVLLENDREMLPLAPCSCAFFGTDQEKMRFYAGGAVSVTTARYYVGAVEGLANAGFSVDQEMLSRYRGQEAYLPSQEVIDAAARCNELAVMILTRYTGEGEDHACYPGDFLLWEQERELLDRIGKAKFRKTLFLINCGAMIDLKPFHDFPGRKAMLLVWLPGMEGGNAIADLVTGKVNPSAKLPDTVGVDCASYPGTDLFRRHPWRVDYSEGIYMGYRYFDTFAPEKILYPFGFGLSYTAFSIHPVPAEDRGEEIAFCAEVRNSGKCAGREVVQWYLAAPGTDDLERPEKMLAAYGKTPLLHPGESCTVEASMRWQDAAFFDDRPGSADCGCWVLSAGEYGFSCGSYSRSTVPSGTIFRREKRVLQHCGILLQETTERRLTRKGAVDLHPSWDTLHDTEPEPPPRTRLPHLKEVANGDLAMAQFLKMLTVDELIHLLHAQGAAFPHGTAGIGNLPRLGIPNAQTCDAAAGLHISTEAVAFPCCVLLASSWDTVLQERYGKALGQEAYDYGCDVILGPGVNLHRTPFCGRNGEYFSEDPLLSGRTGGAVIRGLQSEGIAACLKHFAANNRETNRRQCDSIVPERALRELYLKSFEYAVREGDPLTVMASYGLINGRHTTANYHLLTTILKKEWKSRAVVMTDWRCLSSHLEEILAGCHLRMPLVPDDQEYVKVREAFDTGLLSRARLELLAGELLEFLMQTRSFKGGRETPQHVLKKDGITKIDALAFSEITATRTKIFPCHDPAGSAKGVCHGKLCRDYGGNDPRITFIVSSENPGETCTYRFRIRAAVPGNQVRVLYYLDRELLGELPLRSTFPAAEIKEDFVYDTWETQGDEEITLSPGPHELMIRITDPDNLGVSLNYLEFTAEI